MFDAMPPYRPRNEHLKLLITGFGPFPGVSENLSATLAVSAADHARRLALAPTVVDATLPVVWGEAEQVADDLITRERPGLVVHFGVARQALGLVLERQAVPLANFAPDANGLGPDGLTLTTQPAAKSRDPGHDPGRPPSLMFAPDAPTPSMSRLSASRTDRIEKPRQKPPLRCHGPSALHTKLPLGQLAHALRRRQIATRISHDAGRYLCNAVYYRSLQRCAEASGPSDALFVHVPALAGRESEGISTGAQRALLQRGVETLIERVVAAHLART